VNAFDDKPLSMTLSVSMRVNLGNYEHADAFMSISNVTQETTPEEMHALLDGPGRIAYEVLKEKLRPNIADLRQGIR